MKRLLTLGAAVVMALSSTALIASSASATNPTSPNYSFDGSPHVIVDGGSDTTYKAMVGITNLWNASTGCQVNFPVSGVTSTSTNSCDSTSAPVSAPYANWQHDSVVQGNPAGSGNGIASLNGFIASGSSGVGYQGSINPLPSYLGSSATGPQLDMARSSRGPNTSGGNAIGGNELAVDAFWGFAQDGVQLLTYGSRTAQINAVAGALSPSDLAGIYNCSYTTWGAVPSLSSAVTGGSIPDGPIVLWGMNANSGTYGTMRTYLRNTAGLGASYDINTQACAKHLSSGDFPFENDIKPVLNDVQNNAGALGTAGLSTDPNSKNNPVNWVWFGSFGLMTAYPYLSQNVNVTGAPANPYAAAATAIGGTTPSTSNILALTYPISRTLYSVTRKQDADCPTNGSGACDFVGHPGPVISGSITDLNVKSTATGGTLGAVREFTRFLCRAGAAQQAVDPYTGLNEDGQITSAIGQSNFTVIKASARTGGSRCNVSSTGS